MQLQIIPDLAQLNCYDVVPKGKNALFKMWANWKKRNMQKSELYNNRYKMKKATFSIFNMTNHWHGTLACLSTPYPAGPCDEIKPWLDLLIPKGVWIFAVS